MAMSGDHATSHRRLVLRFAACIAHLLNSGHDGTAVVQPGLIYQRLTRMLARRVDHRRGGNRDVTDYKPLVGGGVFSDRNWDEDGAARDQIAEIYFEYVLDKRLFLARDAHMHKGHELFHRLCRRGEGPGWEAASLGRECTAITSVVPIGVQPSGYGDVSNGLYSLPIDISDGNPARSTQAEVGPLYLRVPGSVHWVAEEMSVWGALKSSPRRLRRLAPGDEFNEFCGLVIKAVETANAHYGALVSLGLSPVDWRELSVNTAKKLSAFLGDVRRLAEENKSDPAALEGWRAVWQFRQVPGFVDAEALWKSDLGRAVRGQDHWHRHHGAVIEDIPDIGRDEEVLNRVSFKKMVAAAREEGVITPMDADILHELYRNPSLSDIASRSDIAAYLGSRRLGAHLATLAQRVREHAKKVSAPLQHASKASR